MTEAGYNLATSDAAVGTLAIAGLYICSKRDSRRLRGGIMQTNRFEPRVPLYAQCHVSDGVGEVVTVHQRPSPSHANSNGLSNGIPYLIDSRVQCCYSNNTTRVDTPHTSFPNSSARRDPSTNKLTHPSVVNRQTNDARNGFHHLIAHDNPGCDEFIILFLQSSVPCCPTPYRTQYMQEPPAMHQRKRGPRNCWGCQFVEPHVLLPASPPASGRQLDRTGDRARTGAPQG